MFQSPGPILFTLGPLTIRWYGLMIALGFVAATFFATRLTERLGLDSEKYVNAALLGFIGGILGARLYYVAVSWSYFSVHPQEILMTWKGGMSIHGGIIGGVLFGMLYLYYNKFPVLRGMDIAGVGLAIGQCIGRWGNFFNSEAFGLPAGADYPLKLFIPLDMRPEKYISHEFFHPTFLYESVFDLLLFLFLYTFVTRKLVNFPGISFMVYLGLYSVGRLAIEPLRLDSIKTNGIPVPIIASIVGIALALLGTLALYRYHSSRKAEDKISAEDVNNEKINADIKDNSVVTEDSDDTNVN